MKISTLAKINKVLHYTMVLLALPFALLSKVLYLPVKLLDIVNLKLGNWLYRISDERNNGTISNEEIKNDRFMNAYTANYWINKEKMPL